MYVCLKCNTKKKLQVIVVNFLLPDVVLGTECLFLGPQGLVFQRNSGQMCRQKKKSYGEFLWPYLNNFAGNIPGPTLSGWKKLRCPFITFKSTQCMLYVSDVLWRISDILYPFDSKELPENYFFYGLVMFQGQCEQVHNNTKNSVFYFFQATQQ